MKAAIITANTQMYKGEVEDKTCPIIERMLNQVGFDVVFKKVVPCDYTVVSTIMERLADGNVVDIIFTIGGTGIKEEDCVPEATKAIVNREIPGIPEAMRAYIMRFTKRTILTRAAAGIRKKTIIVNLLASPKPSKDSLEYVLPELVHAVEILTGQSAEGKSLEA